MLSSSETLAGSAFLAHALSARLGNITNIQYFLRNGRNMPCFVTSWCQAKQARLRGFSAAPLNRGLRNVTWQYVFLHWLFTLVQTHDKYKFFFDSQGDSHFVFHCFAAQSSRVEPSGVECSRVD